MKVCVIGAFGFEMLDKTTGGQPVKTRQLYYALSEHYNEKNISYVETYGWKSHPLQLLKDVLNEAENCDAMIMLPAHRGVQIFSKLLLFCKKKYGIKIFYDVIGGWLPNKTAKSKSLKSCLKKFDGIWVETNSMKVALVSQKFDNVTVVPNFRKMQILKPEELVYSCEYPFKLCTFSRVMKEKGIEDAVDAVNFVNDKLGFNAYNLDIYGPIDESQQEWFESLKEKMGSNIEYKGCVDPGESCNILKDYCCLLFPTYYHGEGLAGTLIDAFFAGLPIIASDWRYNSEIVKENTGFIFPTGNIEKFVEILEKIATNPSKVIEKKKECLKEATKYESKTCGGLICKLLEKS